MPKDSWGLSVRAYTPTENQSKSKVKNVSQIGVLVTVSIIAMKEHNQKANWEGKGLFDFYFISVCHGRKSWKEHKQDRILEIGDDAETIERSCFLTCFPTMRWALSHWSLIEKINTLQPGIMKAHPQLRTFHSHDSSLYLWPIKLHNIDRVVYGS